MTRGATATVARTVPRILLYSREHRSVMAPPTRACGVILCRELQIRPQSVRRSRGLPRGDGKCRRLRGSRRWHLNCSVDGYGIADVVLCGTPDHASHSDRDRGDDYLFCAGLFSAWRSGAEPAATRRHPSRRHILETCLWSRSADTDPICEVADPRAVRRFRRFDPDQSPGAG